MSTLPIRVRLVIGRDGSHVRTLHVFCPREVASIPPERCARCNFRCPPEEGPRAPAVGCSAEADERDCEGEARRSLLYGPNAAAARVPAGAASAQVVVCLHADVPLSVVHGAIAQGRSWLAYPVVDSSGVLLGNVPSSALAVERGAPECLLPASEVMVPTVGVRESDHLDEAIGAMTAHHLRLVPIVDTEHRVTGALSDIEVLRWVARGAPSRWW